MVNRRLSPAAPTASRIANRAVTYLTGASTSRTFDPSGYVTVTSSGVAAVTEDDEDPF